MASNVNDTQANHLYAYHRTAKSRILHIALVDYFAVMLARCNICHTNKKKKPHKTFQTDLWPQMVSTFVCKQSVCTYRFTVFFCPKCFQHLHGHERRYFVTVVKYCLPQMSAAFVWSQAVSIRRRARQIPQDLLIIRNLFEAHSTRKL